MTVNINIKTNADNLTLSQVYELLHRYSLEKAKYKKTYELNGFKYQVESEVNMSINYVITEVE